LGKNRIKGFNFSLPTWDHQNISGLEMRLKLMFGIQNKNIRSLVAPIVDNYQKKSGKEKWSAREVQIIKGPKTKLLSKSGDYSPDEVSIYCPDPSFFKSLFIFAPRSKSYRIVPTRVNNKVVYNLLFNIPNQEFPAVIYRASKKKDCEEKLEQLKEKFRTFNNECEGMFVLEHILLRPLVSTNYITVFKNDQGEEFLKSYSAAPFEDQREFRDDVYVLGVNADNYSVQKVKRKKSFKIVLYDILNNPVFESLKEFDAKADGLDEIQNFINFFKGHKRNKTDLKEFSSINIDIGNSHEFPVDFDYSNSLSIILPNWPFRFQNNEFLDHLKEQINHFIPAHIKFQIYLLEVDKLVLFEETFLSWLKSKMDGNNDVSDLMSMQLIQLLQRYNPLQ
jgi:hypothetical protein